MLLTVVTYPLNWHRAVEASQAASEYLRGRDSHSDAAAVQLWPFNPPSHSLHHFQVQQPEPWRPHRPIAHLFFCCDAFHSARGYCVIANKHCFRLPFLLKCQICDQHFLQHDISGFVSNYSKISAVWRCGHQRYWLWSLPSPPPSGWLSHGGCMYVHCSGLDRR